MKYIFSFFVILSLILISCAEVHPLYGTWADNTGNTISFFSDENSFSAKIYSGSNAINFKGNFTILQNVLIFEAQDDFDNEYKIVTEWDLRGNILYLNWTIENTTLTLILYKISN